MPTPDLFSVKGKKSDGSAFNLSFDTLGSSRFIGPAAVNAVGGTWTLTRNAQGNVSLNKTAAADTSYLLVPLRDLLKPVLATGLYGSGVADRGMKISSIDVVYSIGTAALTTHTPTVNSVVYANNTAVSVAAHGGTLSGTLATATQANPYLSTLTLGTPAFDQTDNSDINLEIAIVAAGTSAYAFYGVLVNFDKNTL